MLVIEPETLRKLHPGLSEEEYNYIQATMTIKNTNFPFEDFYTFENVVWALNKKVPNFLVLEPPPAKYIWLALKIMKNLRPKMGFSNEVKLYVEIVSKDQGYIFLPDELEESKDKFKLAVESRANEILINPDLVEETVLDIQASKYLEITDYIQRNING